MIAISRPPTITNVANDPEMPSTSCVAGDHRVAKERGVHAEPAEVHERDHYVHQRRTAASERTLHQQDKL